MTIPIIAVLGQSNAKGVADVASITNYAALGYNTAYPAVQYMEQVEDAPTDPLVWDTVRGPIDLQARPGGSQGLFGPELSLGRTLHTAGLTHAIAKIAIGSTSLSVHWRAVGSTYPTAAPHLFDQAITFLQSAETALSGYIAALIWIQGEADAGIAAATSYASNFVSFMTQFRSTFPDVPLLFNQLHNLAGGSLNSTVREQQANISELVTRARLFSVDDLSLIGAHFTGDSYVALGARYAGHVLKALGEQPRTISMSASLRI